MLQGQPYTSRFFLVVIPLLRPDSFLVFVSLYGAALWKSSSPQLKSLEVSFNNILRKIWSLPRHSHTGIVHSVARLQSLYNVVLSRSKALITSVKMSSSAMIRDIFSESANCAYTSLGYNNPFGRNHLKIYTTDDHLCAAFIRDARSNPSANLHLQEDIYCICTL